MSAGDISRASAGLTRARRSRKESNHGRDYRVADLMLNQYAILEVWCLVADASHWEAPALLPAPCPKRSRAGSKKVHHVHSGSNGAIVPH